MKTLLRRVLAMIALIAFVVTLLPPSAFAEAKTSITGSQIDSRPAEPNSDATLGIEIVPHKTENPKRSAIWDGSIATGFAGGSGTEEDPYLISDGSELAFLAQEVDNGNDCSGVYFKLTNDICLNDTSDWESWGDGAAPANEWTPIGTTMQHNFNGCFDGDGYAVRGIYINDTEAYNRGLFGRSGGDVGANSIIANLGVAESYICGNSGVGGVVGWNYGYVTNCYNMGSVTGDSGIGGVVGTNAGTVTNCHNEGSVTGELDVGGMIGYNWDGVVTGCYNTGSVTGGDNVGGVIGINDDYTCDTVTDCYNTSSVSGNDCVGGVVGYNSCGDITNCYNIGSVTGELDVGGVIGLSEAWSEDDYATVTNCYNIGGVTGNEYTGGAIGFNGDYALSENCYYLDTCCDNGDEYGTALTDEQMKSSDSFIGFDFVEVWTMEGNPDYPYPELASNIHVVIVVTKPGDADGDGTITIADATLIARMALNLTESVPAADFNGDGSIDMVDATMTARKALNLI